MARQKQRGKSRNPGQSVRSDTQESAMAETYESQGSFVDALNATQQHTVPLLPAYNAPQPRQTAAQSFESPPAPAPSRVSYARATLAPRGSGVQRATPLSETSTSTGDATYQLLAQQPTTRHATASTMRDTIAREAEKSGAAKALPSGARADWRHTDELVNDIAMADNAEQDDADPAQSQGRPTFVLPVIASDNLPVVRAPLAERHLAVREIEEPKAVFIRGASKLPTPYVALAPRRLGPRPFIVQFLVAMVTVMTLFAVLTLASPLGKGLAFSNSFQAYANAMPWIPTPTPTPKPTPAPQFYGQQPGVNPGQQVIINTINAIFGPYAGGALNIARCESGYDPNAYNSYPVAGSHAEGVFQILYPSTWSGTSYARYSPYDYNANIRAAYEIFHSDGNSWREWECRP